MVRIRVRRSVSHGLRAHSGRGGRVSRSVGVPYSIVRFVFFFVRVFLDSKPFAACWRVFRMGSGRRCFGLAGPTFEFRLCATRPVRARFAGRRNQVVVGRSSESRQKVVDRRRKDAGNSPGGCRQAAEKPPEKRWAAARKSPESHRKVAGRAPESRRKAVGKPPRMYSPSCP